MKLTVIAGAVAAAGLAGCTNAALSSAVSVPAPVSARSATVAPVSARSATVAPVSARSATVAPPAVTLAPQEHEGTVTAPGATAAVPPPACSGVRVSAGQPNGTAGSAYVTLTFTNVSAATCTLDGFPGVSLTTADRVQVGASAAMTPKLALPVTLKPGGSATAALRITDAGNYGPTQCNEEMTADIAVYAPGSVTAVYLPYTSEGCQVTGTQLLSVTPVS